MSTREEIKREFGAAAVDFLKRFNMLERNIGYSIRWMKRSFGPDGKDIESTFQGKLVQFKALISQRSLEPDFREWFAAVEHCRLLRNILVHGDWDLMPSFDQPIRFDTQQPGQPESQRKYGEFTMQEFREQLASIERVSDELERLRDVHGF